MCRCYGDFVSGSPYIACSLPVLCLLCSVVLWVNNTGKVGNNHYGLSAFTAMEGDGVVTGSSVVGSISAGASPYHCRSKKGQKRRVINIE